MMLVVRREKVCDGKKKVNTFLDYLSLCLRQIIALVRIRETQHYPVTIIKCLVGVLKACYYIRGSALKLFLDQIDI